jgi:hypothetical protein
MKTRYLFFILPLVLLAACKPEVDEFVPSAGNADFSRYIAVGDFWTAGFADGALYKSGQDNSFPGILAKQFTYAGGGAFKQPFMVDDYGVGISTGVPKPKLELGFHPDCKEVIGLSPAYANVAVDPANLAPIGSQGPFNNIGMPGLKSIYMGVAGFATLNPYFGRFASSPTVKVIEEIPPVNATFFTLWLGMFDIQYFAMLGGVGDQITPTAQFAASLQATLDVLKANGAKGAVANIPDMTNFAYFRTIPYNALPIPDQATADMLNMAYAQLNMIIKGAGSTDTIHFAPGPNPLVIQDASLPWGMRQIKDTELVLLSLPQDSLKCAGWGSQKPVPGAFILDNAEIALVKNAVNEYNEKIAEMATGDVALVNIYGMMQELYMDGLMFDNVQLDRRFVQGNFFSLDGLNPTKIGSAALAYYFIAAINEKFNAQIPQVIVSDYPGVAIP